MTVQKVSESTVQGPVVFWKLNAELMGKKYMFEKLCRESCFPRHVCRLTFGKASYLMFHALSLTAPPALLVHGFTSSLPPPLEMIRSVAERRVS